MFEKVGFENILKSKTAAGIELVIMPNGAYEINVVVLKKNKSAISIEKKAEGLTSVDELAKTIDSNSPIVLSINGKGIIHRKIGVSDTDTLPAILNKVLPNANIEEFIIQRTPIGESQAFISVIRITALNEIVEALQKAKLFAITECFLGPFTVNNILSLLEARAITNNTLVFDKYQLQLNNQQIIDISMLDNANTNEKIVVGGEYLSSKLLVSFATAISYFVDNSKGVINSENINTFKEENKQKRKFELTGWAILVVAFVVLLSNYFVFNYYWQKSQEINTLFTLNESALHRYEALKTEFNNKSKFLEQNGLLENSRTSLYADELAAGLPESIQWLDVNICPIKKKQNSNGDEESYFEKKTITISGKCRRSADLNDWIKQIKKYTWINATSLIDYKQDNANEDGIFLMNIEFNN